MKSLATAFDIGDITAVDVDLVAETEAFLKDEVGMTEEEISALKANLGKSYEKPIEEPIENPFTDVKETDWFYEYVLKMVDKGVIKGYTATTFAPDGDLTRAQMATMLYRLAGSPEVEGECTFVDVAKDAWYVKEVTWAEKNGVVNGVGKGKFDPEGKITREQLVVMMHRLAGLVEADADLSAFADAASVSDWATAAMKWAVKNEIIGGTSMTGSDKLFIDPQGNTTRAQAAKILCVYDSMSK